MYRVNIFFNSRSIIFIYLSLNVILLIYSAIFHKETSNLLIVRLCYLGIFSGIAVFAIKQNRVAVWIIAIFIFTSGLWTLTISLFFISTNQFLIKFLFLVIGSFYCFSAFILAFNKELGYRKKCLNSK